MASLGSWLLDLFYPPRCMICHRLLRSGEREICPGCLQSLPDYDGPEPQVRFAEHCAVTFYYEGRLRESFLRYKFSGLRQYAESGGSWAWSPYARSERPWTTASSPASAARPSARPTRPASMCRRSLRITQENESC